MLISIVDFSRGVVSKQMLMPKHQGWNKDYLCGVLEFFNFWLELYHLLSECFSWKYLHDLVHTYNVIHRIYKISLNKVTLSYVIFIRTACVIEFSTMFLLNAYIIDQCFKVRNMLLMYHTSCTCIYHTRRRVYHHLSPYLYEAGE